MIYIKSTFLMLIVGWVTSTSLQAQIPASNTTKMAREPASSPTEPDGAHMLTNPTNSPITVSNALPDIPPYEPDWIQVSDLTNELALSVQMISTNIYELHLSHADGTRLTLFHGSRRLEVNGTLFWMNGPAIHQATNGWKMTQADFNTILTPLMHPPPARHKLRVMIDPGHGGSDPGGVADNGTQEKDIVLDISMRLRRLLLDRYIPVHLTRSRDDFIPLPDRPKLARIQEATIMVSIHANKAVNTSANGIETFVLPAPGFPSTSSVAPVFMSCIGNQHDRDSIRLAANIHQQLLNKTFANDRGIKRARFAVLRDAPCPTILVEVGFLSNNNDREQLESPAYREKLAEAILAGILAFYNPQEELGSAN